jgi:spore coat polysaccharide biosynthesis protein SpsF
LYEHPHIFRTTSKSGNTDYSHYRLTLDTHEDLGFLRAIYHHFSGRDDFSWREVVDLMEREPRLAELNSRVLQKSVREP